MRLGPVILLASLTPYSFFGQSYTISTFAGDGVQTNIPGVAANLQGGSVAGADSAGNVFITDANYHVVWRLDGKTGILTIVAGNGTWGVTGHNGPATSASLIGQ